MRRLLLVLFCITLLAAPAYAYAQGGLPIEFSAELNTGGRVDCYVVRTCTNLGPAILNAVDSGELDNNEPFEVDGDFGEMFARDMDFTRLEAIEKIYDADDELSSAFVAFHVAEGRMLVRATFTADEEDEEDLVFFVYFDEDTAEELRADWED